MFFEVDNPTVYFVLDVAPEIITALSYSLLIFGLCGLLLWVHLMRRYMWHCAVARALEASQ